MIDYAKIVNPIVAEVKPSGIRKYFGIAETMGAIAASKGKDGVAFREQFVGVTTAAVTKDGGEIDAITSATITSRAVCKGVNDALEAVKTLG